MSEIQVAPVGDNGDEITRVPVYSQEQVALLKSQVFKDSNDDEFGYFMEICKGKRLNPFTKQIYAWKQKEKDKNGNVIGHKMLIVVGIDGLRTIAQRSREYAGGSRTEWCGEDGVWKDVWLSDKYPAAARVFVRGKGDTEPTIGVAHWYEYAKLWNGKATGKWAEMPANMLAKCAEALALRKRFPDDLSGLYSPEEIDHAENPAPSTSHAAAPGKKLTANWSHVRKTMGEEMKRLGMGREDMQKRVDGWLRDLGKAKLEDTDQEERDGFMRALAMDYGQPPEVVDEPPMIGLEGSDAAFRNVGSQIVNEIGRHR